MDKDVFAFLFESATSEEQILDVASDILTETIELLLDLGITSEVLKAYIDQSEREYSQKG